MSSLKHLVLAIILGMLVLPCLSASTLRADVRLPELFCDNMVVQQKTLIPVWGWAEANEKVMVEGSWGKNASTHANADGRWMLKESGRYENTLFIVTADNGASSEDMGKNRTGVFLNAATRDVVAWSEKENLI